MTDPLDEFTEDIKTARKELYVLRTVIKRVAERAFEWDQTAKRLSSSPDPLDLLRAEAFQEVTTELGRILATVPSGNEIGRTEHG